MGLSHDLATHRGAVEQGMSLERTLKQHSR
jgi:hypothetical protein